MRLRPERSGLKIPSNWERGSRRFLLISRTVSTHFYKHVIRVVSSSVRKISHELNEFNEHSHSLNSFNSWLIFILRLKSYFSSLPPERPRILRSDVRDRRRMFL